MSHRLGLAVMKLASMYNIACYKESQFFSSYMHHIFGCVVMFHPNSILKTHIDSTRGWAKFLCGLCMLQTEGTIRMVALKHAYDSIYGVKTKFLYLSIANFFADFVEMAHDIVQVIDVCADFKKGQFEFVALYSKNVLFQEAGFGSEPRLSSPFVKFVFHADKVRGVELTTCYPLLFQKNHTGHHPIVRSQLYICECCEKNKMFEKTKKNTVRLFFN